MKNETDTVKGFPVIFSMHDPFRGVIVKTDRKEECYAMNSTKQWVVADEIQSLKIREGHLKEKIKRLEDEKIRKDKIEKLITQLGQFGFKLSTSLEKDDHGCVVYRSMKLSRKGTILIDWEDEIEIDMHGDIEYGKNE